MAQANQQTGDTDPTIDDAPVELGSTPADSNNINIETNNTETEQRQSNVSNQSNESKTSSKATPRTGNLRQGLTSGLSSAFKATKAATQKVSQTAQRLIAPKHGSVVTNNDENESKTPRTNWIPTKQIVYNEGSIKRNVKRVLVTGGAGFIGSHLVDELMSRGYDVICLDNLFSGNKDNVWKWFGNPNFEFIRHDVTQPFFAEVDEIYHLACPASPVFYQNNPIKTLKTNFVGTYNMLGLAKRVGARMLITSTSEVYGDPTVHPQTEEYWGNVNPIGIRSCYDEGKRVAETLMMEYNRLHGVDIAIARIFNTYGPRMLENDGRVVSNFIVQALNGEDLTIYGDGKQTRSFCYIDDQIRGLISLMESGQRGPINIGNPNEYTIKQLATNTVELVNKRLNEENNNNDEKRKQVGFVNRPLPSDDPKKRKPDITKAKKLLKWEPKIELKEGLSKTIDYFYQYLENQKNDPNLTIKTNYLHSKENEANESVTPIDASKELTGGMTD